MTARAGDGTVTFTATAVLLTGGEFGFINRSDIILSSADGNTMGNVTHNPAAEATPSWSPDGNKIIFVRGRTVQLMNANGSNPVRIDKHPTGGQQPRLRP